MNIKTLTAISLAAAINFTAAPLAAQTGDPVGYVDRKRGEAGTEVWIERGNKKVRAVPGAPLHAGDTIRVRGDTNYVRFFVSGKKGLQEVSPGQSYTINQPEEPSWADRFSTLVSNVGSALGITDRTTPQNTFSRSFVVRDPDDTTRPEAEVLSRIPALDTSTLYASRDLDVLALRWCGDALAVHVRSGGLLIEGEDPENIGFGVADITSFVDREDGAEYPADSIEVEAAAGPDLEYSIKWIDMADVPRPASLKATSKFSPADKLEWANWLIEDGNGVLGSQYNLIAFSLLAEAREDIWVAGHVLERASYCPSSESAPAPEPTG